MKKLAWLLPLLLAACPQLTTVDHCAPLETRCNGQVAELCASNGNWTLTMDCSKSPGFVCAMVESAGGHTCVKAN